MTKIAISPNVNGTGTFTLAAPDSNTDRTLTLPDAGGEVFSQGNILGTVSQSAGVPTGAIIQRGSNDNGEFVRYADGTQICTKTFDVQHSPKVTSTVRMWTYPVAFIDASNLGVSGIFYCIEQGVSFRNGVLLTHQTQPKDSNSTIQLLGRDFAGGLFSESHMKVMAIGRWF